MATPLLSIAHDCVLTRVDTPDQLASDPIGRYWLGASHLVWCRDSTTCGSISWGQPTSRDVDELTRALELARHPALARGFAVLMDCRAIEGVDWAPFAQLLDYVRARLPEWSTRIRRQAVIIRSGPIGAVLASSVALLGVPYPMRFVYDMDAALDWLGWSTQFDAQLAVEEAAQLARAATGASTIVQRLQAWLEQSLTTASVDAAAAALAVSSRTLQRALRDAGTAFITELHAARVRVASTLLVETDEKVEVIARDVGYSSASQLSSLFRRRVGETPARYRERCRGSIALRVR
jgi:AraC-like DNA-binding protein